VLEWVGRYALVEPDFSKRHSLIGQYFQKDNTQNIDRGFIQRSHHKFFV
jgi:hypothetical protein